MSDKNTTKIYDRWANFYLRQRLILLRLRWCWQCNKARTWTMSKTS